MDDLSSQIADTGKIPQLPASQIKIPEDAQLPPSTQGMASDLDNLASSVGGQLVKSMSKIPEAEREKAAAAKTEATSEAEQWTSYQKELRDIYKNSAPTPLSTQAAPKLPDDDPVRNFGSLASMIGIFASAFTKKPIVNALNASADAMKAEQAGNREAYDRAYQEWKDQTDLAFKRHSVEVEQLNEIMELAGKDQTAALAKLKAYGVVNSSDAASTLAELGDWEEIGKYTASMQTMKIKAKEAARKMEELNEKKQDAPVNRALKQAQTEYYGEKTKSLASGGGISSAQRVKLEGIQGDRDDALDSITQALKIMDDSYAIAGLGGSIRQHVEPLSNLMGSDTVAGKRFVAKLADLKLRIPSLTRGSSGRGLKADESTINDLIGGTGFGNSTASTYARLLDLQDTIMKDRNRSQKLLSGKSENPAADAETLGIPGDNNAWEDAPIISEPQAPETPDEE